ncbi:prealbumin-like fold domain-containing protein [Clostridium sp.]|uniref:prealbumin-like fold domain-containing protein n=1 Tax=Clostridium sp. TaxID=1506 RepID=UPI002A9184D6|nr:prealbumin-like fold domain-containing protein [Clostridium sp.]MDY6012555.1 prealbumin-like fold domain-containing protein [Clostridium sp.]
MEKEVYKKYDNKVKSYNCSENKNIKGTIIVHTLMDSINGEKLKGIKINLYRINGVSPYLISSKYSDENGIVKFSNIEDGNYRVIEIINKKLYEKPSYVKWNEINISNYLKEETIYVINKKKEVFIN